MPCESYDGSGAMGTGMLVTGVIFHLDGCCCENGRRIRRHAGKGTNPDVNAVRSAALPLDGRMLFTDKTSPSAPSNKVESRLGRGSERTSYHLTLMLLTNKRSYAATVRPVAKARRTETLLLFPIGQRRSDAVR